VIKSVVFDWGGVISPAGTPDEVGISLSQLVKADLDYVKDAFRLYAEDFKRGKLKEDDFWKLIQNKFNIQIEPAKRSIWTNVKFFQPSSKISNFVQELKSKKLDVSILSNTFPPTASDIKDKGWYDDFDSVVLSSDVGFAKPDIEIYELLLKTTGYQPEETVFIDDQEKCLVPARNLGFQTVLAVDTDQIIDQVNKILQTSLLYS